MWRRKSQLLPIEVVRASAAELMESKSPFDSFAGRVALLEPIEFHRHDSILGGSLNSYSRWSFAYDEVGHRERSIYKDVVRHLWVGKRVGQLMLTASFFSISDGVMYSSQLQRFPYARHAFFSGTRNGMPGESESLDESSQMAKDIEMGLMSQDHPSLQSYRSLAETYQGDDPEQRRVYEDMARDAAQTFYPGYDLIFRGIVRDLHTWED